MIPSALPTRLRPAALLLAALAPAAAVPAQFGAAGSAVVDEQATMADRLGARAVLDGTFRDETGREVVLRDLLSGERPLLLNLGYFSCPGMCDVVLNQTLRAIGDSEMTPGEDFDLVTVSIDDADTPEVAALKKANYVESLDGAAWTAGWHLLTGARDAIDPLADSVGWRFREDELTGEYDHPPTIVLISPSGTVSRYLDARGLDPTNLRRAVVEAGDGQVGTFVERILVSCLTFDPTTGAYTMTAMTVMRIGGALTAFALSFMILALWRRERRRRQSEAAAAATA